MRTVRIVQAVVLMLIVAVAASCAASKEYTSKLFTPRNPTLKDSPVVALRFLELDETEVSPGEWVSTDIIMGRDTLGQTLALDKLSKTLPVSPATPAKKDTAQSGELKNTGVIAEVKPVKENEEPLARSTTTGNVRNKKTREE